MENRLATIIHNIESNQPTDPNVLGALRLALQEHESQVAQLTALHGIAQTKVEQLTARLDIAPRKHLEHYLDWWCGQNDCEPEDTDALLSEVIDKLDEMLEEMADENPDLFGKEREFKVEAEITMQGYIIVTARSEREATDAAYDSLHSADLDTEDSSHFSVNDVTIDGCEEN